MAYSMRKRIKRAIYRFILAQAYRDLLEEEFGKRVVKSVSRDLGTFLDGQEFRHLDVSGIGSESGVIMGEIVHVLKSVAQPADILLLAGDRNSAKSAYSKISGIPETQISTAGLHDEMDFSWNYEIPPPTIPPVNIIVSQAMLEHLVDPYRHLADCYGLLRLGGLLVAHTVMPGFQYHRFPVDCQRFYPDWFEVAAERFGAEVVMRIIGSEGHIVYCLRKPQSSVVV